MPTKRAVTVGVDLYPPPADDLKAAATEARNWEQILLAECGFDEVRCLIDDKAERLAILNAMRELLTGLVAGDYFVFTFLGHGAEARGWIDDTTTNDDAEHALIAYAGTRATSTFQFASVTPSDIARTLRDLKVDAGVHVALVIGSCFAEKFGGAKKYDAEPPVNPKVLFIPNAVPGLPAGEPKTFDAIKAMVGDSSIADPIILAASRFNEPAHEDGPDSNRRMLFCQKLQKVVKDAFPGTDSDVLTYREAIDGINPVSDVQYAVIAGNDLLEGDAFAGGFAAQAPRRAALLARTSKTAASAPVSVASAKTAGIALAPVGSLDIRILGLVTLVNLPPSKLPYRNRLITPLDNQWTTPETKHEAFIEVADRDMDGAPTLRPSHEYLKGGIKYSRWQFDRHRVTIENAFETGLPVQRSATYDQHVPSLPEVCVSGILDPNYARPEAYDDSPMAGTFTAFFDLQSGSITVDPRDLEKHRTRYKTRYTNVVTWGPEYTAISVILTVPLKNTSAVIRMLNAAGNASFVFVRSGATILFGNARELDILGPGSGEGPREHFLTYYQLAPSEPANAGLPERYAVPINACTPTNWP
jgi:hypothetical protein